jgi:hypothetical protein
MLIKSFALRDGTMNGTQWLEDMITRTLSITSDILWNRLHQIRGVDYSGIGAPSETQEISITVFVPESHVMT